MISNYLRIPIFSITFGLCLSSCQDEGSEVELKHDLTIAETKLVLASSKDENNLIIKIEKGNPVYIIHFESENIVTIQSQLITKIEYDSANWLVTFHFQDNTVQSANFLGELNFDENDIVLNPYLTSPLTAFAEIKTPVKGKFKVAVRGKPSGGITIEKCFDSFGENHELSILGLYEDYDNEVEFTFMNEGNKIRWTK
ncbi:MAG TPA: aryl-sulfate sulfotransferase N-terminal domain-containing protein, partial [Ignavibacteriaceae bacterium]